jgi:hypothetical protein
MKEVKEAPLEAWNISCERLPLQRDCARPMQILSRLCGTRAIKPQLTTMGLSNPRKLHFALRRPPPRLPGGGPG